MANIWWLSAITPTIYSAIVKILIVHAQSRNNTVVVCRIDKVVVLISPAILIDKLGIFCVGIARRAYPPLPPYHSSGLGKI